jgi:hypothetical protein
MKELKCEPCLLEIFKKHLATFMKSFGLYIYWVVLYVLSSIKAFVAITKLGGVCVC